MNILVPLDFSPDSLQALRYAAALAKQWRTRRPDPAAADTELLIYHAFHAPLGVETSFFVDAAMLDSAEREERNKIQQLIATLPELYSIPHRVVASLALPKEGVPQMVKDEHIDLVVMGGKGANESSVWMGSTTLKVIKQVSCPVLAVPHETETFHPRQVALATDLQALEGTSLTLLKQLLYSWQASLHIIHVHPHPSAIGIEQAEEALHLEHLFRDIPHTYHFPTDQAPTRGIVQYLKEHPVDLLVVIPRYHFALDSLFHKSVTKYLATQTSVPLLTFHEKL